MRKGCSQIFENAVYIREGSTVAGKIEGEGPLKNEIDIIVEDDFAGEDNWEMAESKLQQLSVDKLLIKSGLTTNDINYIYAGDLLGQLIATSFGMMKYELPLFGLYSACSTMGEALALGAMSVNAGYADNVIALASSHFASAEKQFRFPLDYGNQRPKASTWTVTGCGSYILSNIAETGFGEEGCATSWKQGGRCNKRHIKITGITTGKIVDYGVKDSMNMGACMAPAAASLIETNLKDLEVQPDYYDLIITGDLGVVGKTILTDLLKEKGIDVSNVLDDCGLHIYGVSEDEMCSGGSGCGCSAVVLNTFIIPNMKNGRFKRILFCPTGALLSQVSFNEGRSIPGICHGIMLEVE